MQIRTKWDQWRDDWHLHAGWSEKSSLASDATGSQRSHQNENVLIKTKTSGTSDQLKSRYSKQLKATSAVAKTQRKIREHWEEHWCYRNVKSN